MENMEATDIIAKILETRGVKDAVVSSGSRCLRMVRAVDDNPAIAVRMVVDERVAAFMALGISDATQRPVALVCTSGSAMLNYAPAIAEAYYRGVPLIVITADRPPEMLEINDGQTILQFHALDNIVKESVDVDATKWCDNNIFDGICRTVDKALKPRKGPVHINLHLHEGLAPLELPPAEQEYSIPHFEENEDGEEDANVEVNVNIEASLVRENKVMIFIGQRYYDGKFDKMIESLAGIPNIVVFADRVSNCKARNVLTDLDMLMRELPLHNDGGRYCPDLLITFGKTSPLSRRFKEWLRKSKDCRHWSVTDKATPEDTYNHLEHTILVDDDTFMEWMLDKVSSSCSNRYKRDWMSLNSEVVKKKKAVLDNLPWCDVAAVNTIVNAVPHRCAVISSNGMSIRNITACISYQPERFFCNRGVNGIDGSTSTALGYSVASEEMTVLISGDMSAIYDISALYSGYLNPRFKMIVIANGGGEIFRAIKATSGYEARERLLCHTPQIQWRYVAKSVGMEYHEASGKDELEEILPSFFKLGNRAGLLVVNTPADNSGTLEMALKEYEERSCRTVCNC